MSNFVEETPDTGLVTWKFHAPEYGTAKMIESAGGEWILRENAEELLAAERAEHDNTIATLSSLIEDNAAQAARIKELEAEFDQAVGVIEDRSSENQALEAKLAEAKKVFEFFTDASFDDALVKYQEFQDRAAKARAVLGGK